MSRQITVYPCQYPGCLTDIESFTSCPRKYCDAHKYQVIKERNRIRERVRRGLLIERICVRCGGKITKPYNKRYCTIYCYWMNDLKNHSKHCKKQEMFAR